MNNKGTTLIEILVSIILITIVIVFIFSMLMDLRNEDFIASNKNEDSLNRSSIIHLIENDFINKGLTKIKNNKCSDNDCIKLTFTYSDGVSKELEVRNNYVAYDNEIWIISEVDGMSTTTYDFSKATWCYKAKEDTYVTTNKSQLLFTLSIPTKHSMEEKRKVGLDISYSASRANPIELENFDKIGPNEIIKVGSITLKNCE